MRILSVSHAFTNLIPSRPLSVLTFVVLGVSIMSLSVPSSALAAAEKRIDGTGPFSPGDTVTVEIRVPKPTNITISPFEVVFVVDASGSMASDISTAKSKMATFANWIADPNGDGNTVDNLYGYVKVGVMSYGFEDTNPSRDPSIRTYYSLTTINSATDKNALINGINAIQANPAGWGFSDIRAGLQAANDLLSTSSSSGKYIVLVTDGINNMPASGSYPLGPWSGQCPLNSNRTANISGIRFNSLLVVAVGNDLYNQVPSETDYDGSTGLDQYIPSCQQYIWNNGSRTGSAFINDIVSYFPGSNSRSSTIDEPILAIKQAVTPITVQIQDYINADVFSSIPDAGVVRNCATGTILTGNNTVSGLRLTSNVNYYPGVNIYCVRFKATIKSGVTSGTYSINSSPDAANSWVRYYNTSNQVIASDSIQLGSMSISGNPDMAVSELWLTNSSGTQKRVFDRNEGIYVHTKIENVGDSTMPANFKTAFYKNASSTVAANTSSDIPMYITGHGALGAGGSRSYDSFSSTFPSTTDPNTANTNGARPWTQPAAANYNAVAFTNYTQSSAESNYPDNNRVGHGYSVITPPSNLQTQNLRCYSSDLTWTAASSNVTGYDVEVTDMAALLDSIINGTPYNDYPTYDHSIPAAPTNTSVANLKGNTLYSWTLTPKTVYGSGNPVSINFTTPACPTYTMDLGGPYAAEPGEVQVLDVNIGYTPDAATWNTYGARLDVRVVGIRYNNDSCSGFTPTSGPSFTAVDGFSVRSSSNPSLASYSIGPSTHPYQVKFTATTTANTDTGRYTVCIGYFSPDSYITYRDVQPIHINVERHPWIQVDWPSNTTTSMVGDVHSNAAIDLGVPVSQYFFRDGTAGVVSAYGTGSANISFATNRTVNTANANLTNKLWRIPSYTERIKTEAYSNLEALAVASLSNPATGLPDAKPSNANINGHCANGSKVYKYTPATGEISIDDAIDLSSKPCENTSLVYFVDGDLRVNANIVDGTTSTTITFIAKGDIIVNSSVTQMDGVYIFGGSFRDGSVYNTAAGTKDQPLVINGSLIGLATQSPVSTKGTFSQGTFSGLQRNLSYGPTGNDTVPAERIVFQPKYLFLLRELLGASSFTWSE